LPIWCTMYHIRPNPTANGATCCPLMNHGRVRPVTLSHLEMLLEERARLLARVTVIETGLVAQGRWSMQRVGAGVKLYIAQRPQLCSILECDHCDALSFTLIQLWARDALRSNSPRHPQSIPASVDRTCLSVPSRLYRQHTKLNYSFYGPIRCKRFILSFSASPPPLDLFVCMVVVKYGHRCTLCDSKQITPVFFVWGGGHKRIVNHVAHFATL
jgi:hypothetical protein